MKNGKILLEAKIICVADVVEAVPSHCPYSPTLGINIALEEIVRYKNILYDSEVVDACVQILKKDSFYSFAYSIKTKKVF